MPESQGQEWWMPYMQKGRSGGSADGSASDLYDYYFGPTARERKFTEARRDEMLQKQQNLDQYLKQYGAVMPSAGGERVPGDMSTGRPEAVKAGVPNDLVANPQAMSYLQQFQQGDATIDQTKAGTRLTNAQSNASEFDTGEKNRTSLGQQEMARKVSEFITQTGKQPTPLDLQQMFGGLKTSSGVVGAEAIRSAEELGKRGEMGKAYGPMMQQGVPKSTPEQAAGMAAYPEGHALFSTFMRDFQDPNMAMQHAQTVTKATQFISQPFFQKLPEVTQAQIRTAIGEAEGAAGTPAFDQKMGQLAEIIRGIMSSSPMNVQQPNASDKQLSDWVSGTGPEPQDQSSFFNTGWGIRRNKKEGK